MVTESLRPNRLVALFPGWLGALLMAPVASAAGGLLSAAIVVVASLPFEAPATSWRPELVAQGAFVGLNLLMWTLPTILVAIHLAAVRWLPGRYGTLMGWGGFLAGGALPYLVYPGYSDFLIGLVAGMGAAWAFSKGTPFDDGR